MDCPKPVARFFKGGGSTLCQSKGTQEIVSHFCHLLYVCLKQAYKVVSRAPQEPLVTPLSTIKQALSLVQ